ncbi:uncharacterized protein LOC123194206 [Mangifera indica]|uniref:uncharacterized protein LOC123194206 n=1 Tax=Mangifera indica TaxID=29780 RepID=UPI001CFB1B16|nr:uncharacterized protein LOC123194206 [Mangifera indica]
MALEMCHYPLKTTICDYVSLMDHLMETSKDVDLMVQKGILVNGLGDSNEIVTLVKKLGTHIPQDCQSSRYAWLFMHLNRHCENRWVKPKYQDNIWQKWLKILKDEYFSTPWRSASTIAAIILLVLTFIQTVFAIIK